MPLLQQPGLTRSLQKLMGGASSSDAVSYLSELRPTLELADLLPRQVDIDSSGATPAGGRDVDFTVPSTEIWMVDATSGINVNTPTQHQVYIRPQAGATTMGVFDSGAAYPANRLAVFIPQKPLVLHGGGLVKIRFGAGVLNDTTRAELLSRRFSI